MVVENDMSLITFLPLTYIVLHSTKNDKYLAFTFIMQTIAANMGGMITPHGNPQNLYLYSYYKINTIEFFSILLLFIYSILFAFVILSIFRILPYMPIATFCVFFIFSGNIARIENIKTFISKFVVNNTMLAGILSCQLISNVPTAIFLSKFTTNYQELLISVNIGSLGIIISSLASLITLKEFLKHQPKNFWKYLGMFTIFNTLFLSILLLITKLLFII